METSAEYWIKRLQLSEHPEGGYFTPAYRSSERIGKDFLPGRFPGDRAIVSSIYYLLKKGQCSVFHRLKSVEIWNFYEGSFLTIYILEIDGSLSEKKLGRNVEKGESFQLAIEPGRWFGAMHSGPGEFSLVGCTVAPGFEYQDMVFADRATLIEQYPNHRDLIEKLTRG